MVSRNGWQVGVCALAVILTALGPLGSANAQRDWAATLYTGQLTDESLAYVTSANFTMVNAYWVGLGGTRRIYTYRHYFDLEVEGQVNKFFGYQDHWEWDCLGYIRWLPFPWDHHLDTSFAAGAGLSYATSVPEVEVDKVGTSAQFLAALSFEFAFVLPRSPEWNLIVGIHHRSGAGGNFSGVHGGSNGLNLGLRYWF